MKKITFCLLLFMVTQFAWSQEHAWVYFTDKENVAQAIANPSTILTQRAIDRKQRHNIAIDERDVPINENYVSTIKQQGSITVLAQSKWFNCVHVVGIQSQIQALTSLPFVSSVFFADRSLNSGGSSSSVANRTRTYKKQQNKFDNQNFLVDFNYGSASTQIQMLNADKLHEQDYTGEGVVIAIMDTGFPNVNTMSAFQRLRDNGDLLGGYDFVDGDTDYFNANLHNHGTQVLSTMAAYVEDQYVGTAPDASYYLFRTENSTSETPVEETYWVAAAERADSLGVDLINTSLGYNRFDEPRYNYNTSDMDGNTAFITRGANIAVEKGMLVVNSAGNSGQDSSWGIITAPADGNVFSIGAVDASENYALFSSTGPAADLRIKPDVMAMGQSASVINEDNTIISNSGTSFSSPILAGALASLWQADPNRTNLEMMQFVRESASLYTSPTDQMGYGIPNFETALEEVIEDIENTTNIKLFPNPITNSFQVDFPSTIEEANVTLYDVLGKRIKNQRISEGNNTVNTSGLSKGVYMVKIQTPNIQKTIKVVKQ